MSVFLRFFCIHKWKSHAKKVDNRIKKIEGTWSATETIYQTTEILICEKCGEINKIKY